MAEKKKGKKRRDECMYPEQLLEDKPSKEEFQIAKWMRKNVPIKRTKFLNHNVEYFTGSRAVDAILQSDYVSKEDGLFKTREEICDFLHVMLIHKFFHRALKVPIDEHELKNKKNKKKEKKGNEVSEENKKEKKDKGTDAESSVVEGNKDLQPEKEKRKKKVRLDMHNDQRFVDNLDAYVWIYDPIPLHYWIIGTLLVLGAIGICLFPLWPPSVRLGVYYLSVAAAGFLVTIIVLAILRLIIFCLIWMITLGKHHLWILPNLTEDVGFFASFWPLYTYEYKGRHDSNSKKSKKKKTKDSDAEEDNKGNTKDEKPEEQLEVSRAVEASDADDTNREKPSGSESESESSQRSSTGKDFEMVNQEELES